MRLVLALSASALFGAALFGGGAFAGYAPAPEDAGPRLALVVGNAEYQMTGWRLENADEDARQVADALTAVGFQVSFLENAGEQDLRDAVREFGNSLQEAGETAVGFFYYSGHGVQSQGINYLVPVDVAARTEADIWAQGVQVGLIEQFMTNAGSAVNFIVLDACRNNPLPTAYRSAGGSGLASIGKTRGVLYAYATEPGAVALDGDSGAGGPYAQALSRYLTTPGLPAELMFKRVAEAVEDTTGFAQSPFYESGLRGAEFFFASGEAPPPEQIAIAPSPETSPPQSGPPPSDPAPSDPAPSISGAIGEASVGTPTDATESDPLAAQPGVAPDLAPALAGRWSWEDADDCANPQTVRHDAPDALIFEGADGRFDYVIEADDGDVIVTRLDRADGERERMSFTLSPDQSTLWIASQGHAQIDTWRRCAALDSEAALTTGDAFDAADADDGELRGQLRLSVRALEAWAGRSLQNDAVIRRAEAGDFIFFPPTGQDLPGGIGPRIKGMADRLNARLAENPKLTVEVVGACTGSEARLTICSGRAKALRAALLRAGVPVDRMRGASTFGKHRPIDDGAGGELDALNRYAWARLLE